jgi:hypothetical protein
MSKVTPAIELMFYTKEADRLSLASPGTSPQAQIWQACIGIY